ncbi:ring-cleaving dioxygenase [Negadavirga shengliensis]|uniref:Ring-cleaving dioxygenase n=1 Tax=Negadavirga shengliensis TaxID=1389218 RepID=A0ABV9T4Y4_9BACT
MEKLIRGIHHITAIASNPQRNVDFYTQVLGLRLVKKTINFDAPNVYHFYFGDEVGSPGTVLTFFPFDGAKRGRKGVGEMTYTAFSVAKDALPYWRERLKGFGISISDTLERFGDRLIRFEDHDGLGIELVANETDSRKGWAPESIPAGFAIKGFYGATLNLRAKDLTAELLTNVLDYRLLAEDNGRFRYVVDEQPGEILDIVLNDPEGRSIQSAGTVHHIAFRTDNTDTQSEMQHKLLDYGQQVTSVKDRNYFKSIYFREPGGILFEVATDGPGFAIDEEVAHLGEKLKLPDWALPQKDLIERQLPEVKLNYKIG